MTFEWNVWGRGFRFFGMGFGWVIGVWGDVWREGLKLGLFLFWEVDI